MSSPVPPILLSSLPLRQMFPVPPSRTNKGVSSNISLAFPLFPQ
jgi:hypothetical protein